MKKLSYRQRDECMLALLPELSEAYRLLASVPNVVGPAYGAKMCDCAAKLRHALERLFIGCPDILGQAAWETTDDWPWNTTPHLCPRTARNGLRERAAEHALAEGDPRIRHTKWGEAYPPLTATEHRQLGTDLITVNATLSTAFCALANPWGKSHDLCNRARKAKLTLLSLRARLDTILHQEQRDYPGVLAGFYFGPPNSGQAAHITTA